MTSLSYPRGLLPITRPSQFDQPMFVQRGDPKSILRIDRWSGITEEILSKATLTLPEVQSALLSRSDLITPHTILLGHSLENDLLALKIRHPLVVDTALLFPHAKGRPSKPSLRWLTGKWLGREIQNRGAAGHDSAEDAMACLELLKRKCSEGSLPHG